MSRLFLRAIQYLSIKHVPFPTATSYVHFPRRFRFQHTKASLIERSRSNFQISNDNILAKILSKLLFLLTTPMQHFPFNSILDLAGVSIHPCFVIPLAVVVRSSPVLGYLNLQSKKQEKKRNMPKSHHLFLVAENVLLAFTKKHKHFPG